MRFDDIFYSDFCYTYISLRHIFHCDIYFTATLLIILQIHHLVHHYVPLTTKFKQPVWINLCTFRLQCGWRKLFCLKRIQTLMRGNDIHKLTAFPFDLMAPLTVVFFDESSPSINPTGLFIQLVDITQRVFFGLETQIMVFEVLV